MRDRSDERLVRWLREQLQRAARLGGRHRMLVDVMIAAAIAALSLVGLAARHRLGHPGVIVFCIALCVPLPLRRRSQAACFALVALVAFVQWLTSTPQLADAAVLVALYWVALDGEPTEIVVASVVVEAGAIMAATRWSPSQSLKVWVGLSGLAVAAGVLGVTIRQRRALLNSLQEKAARLEFERDQEGRLGAAAERARIAREMHDIVAHNLTMMIGLADGASYALDSSPERALSAMERVSATGRQALMEMRRLLGVLRDEADAHPLEPQPDLDRLDDLVARVEAAGIPVTLETDGDPQVLSGGGHPVGGACRVRRARTAGNARTGRRIRRTTRGWSAIGGRMACPPQPDAGRTQPGVMTTEILLVDDQELMRMGFRMVIDSQADLAVVGEAADGREAIEVTTRLEPDVILMDVRMPEMDGVEATRLIVESDSKTRIIILTTFDLDEYVYAALRAGASGFLLKDTQPADLLSAIRAVANGDAVVAPRVTRRLLSTYAHRLPSPTNTDAGARERLEQLTAREHEVLLQVARSLSNAEIAEQLMLSEATVKSHVGRILSKLDLRDRVQIVVFACESGLITPAQT
jgi:DNA-binding NarL/FixJ family response regulator/signal transduction histidine kinase